MFMSKIKHAECEFDQILQQDVLANLLSRRNDEFAERFTAQGTMRLVDLDDGSTFERATGRRGVESLARSIHENVQISDFVTNDMTWLADGVEFGWTATIRNWGIGAARRTRGRIRLTFDGASVSHASLALERDVYFSQLRPDMSASGGPASWRQEAMAAV